MHKTVYLPTPLYESETQVMFDMYERRVTSSEVIYWRRLENKKRQNKKNAYKRKSENGLGSRRGKQKKLKVVQFSNYDE